MSEIVAFVSVVVTVLLFTLSQSFLVRTSRRAAKAALVQSVLDALGQVARTHARPAIARMWTKPEIEYALLVPQLLVGLAKRDRVLALWTHGRVQDMLAAATQSEVVRIASDISGKLADWQLGERDRMWFAQEVKDHTPKPPRTTIRSTATALEATGEVALMVGTAAAAVGVMAGLAQRIRSGHRDSNGRWGRTPPLA